MERWEFFCPKCDNHVHVTLATADDETQVEAFCCTAHLRPIRMTTTDPHAD